MASTFKGPTKTSGQGSTSQAPAASILPPPSYATRPPKGNKPAYDVDSEDDADPVTKTSRGEPTRTRQGHDLDSDAGKKPASSRRMGQSQAPVSHAPTRTMTAKTAQASNAPTSSANQMAVRPSRAPSITSFQKSEHTSYAPTSSATQMAVRPSRAPSTISSQKSAQPTNARNSSETQMAVRASRRSTTRAAQNGESRLDDVPEDDYYNSEDDFGRGGPRNSRITHAPVKTGRRMQTLEKYQEEDEDEGRDGYSQAVTRTGGQSKAISTYNKSSKQNMSDGEETITVKRFRPVRFNELGSEFLDKLTSICGVSIADVKDYCENGKIEYDERTKKMRLERLYELFPGHVRARLEFEMEKRVAMRDREPERESQQQLVLGARSAAETSLVAPQAPAPVYGPAPVYAPAPVVYAPPPVVYAPPPVFIPTPVFVPTPVILVRRRIRTVWLDHDEDCDCYRCVSY